MQNRCVMIMSESSRVTDLSLARENLDLCIVYKEIYRYRYARLYIIYPKGSYAEVPGSRGVYSIRKASAWKIYSRNLEARR